MADGTLVGQRITDLRKQLVPGGPMATPKDFKSWVDTQSWLYTKRNDFGEFDLHVEYWTKTSGNSGVSIRDTSRAKWASDRRRRITRRRPRRSATRSRSIIGFRIRILRGAFTGSWMRRRTPSTRRRLERDGHPIAER